MGNLVREKVFKIGKNLFRYIVCKVGQDEQLAGRLCSLEQIRKFGISRAFAQLD